jgi:hypothetical protein
MTPKPFDEWFEDGKHYVLPHGQKVYAKRQDDSWILSTMPGQPQALYAFGEDGEVVYVDMEKGRLIRHWLIDRSSIQKTK